MLCRSKEEREKRQRQNTEKREENAEQRGRKEEEAFIEKDAMWHRQQDRAGKHSHLSTPASVQSDTVNQRAPPTGREDKALRGAERPQGEEG